MKQKGMRIIAWVCIVLLLGLYVVTVIAAVTASPYSMGLFMGCLASTVFVPIFLYILTRLFAHMTKRSEGDTTLHELHKARREQKKHTET